MLRSDPLLLFPSWSQLLKERTSAWRYESLCPCPSNWQFWWGVLSVVSLVPKCRGWRSSPKGVRSLNYSFSISFMHNTQFSVGGRFWFYRDRGVYQGECSYSNPHIASGRLYEVFIFSHTLWITTSCTCLWASPSCFGVTNCWVGERSTEWSPELNARSYHAFPGGPQLS